MLSASSVHDQSYLQLMSVNFDLVCETEMESCILLVQGLDFRQLDQALLRQ